MSAFELPIEALDDLAQRGYSAAASDVLDAKSVSCVIRRDMVVDEPFCEAILMFLARIIQEGSGFGREARASAC